MELADLARAVSLCLVCLLKSLLGTKPLCCFPSLFKQLLTQAKKVHFNCPAYLKTEMFLLEKLTLIKFYLLPVEPVI